MIVSIKKTTRLPLFSAILSNLSQIILKWKDLYIYEMDSGQYLKEILIRVLLFFFNISLKKSQYWSGSYSKNVRTSRLLGKKATIVYYFFVYTCETESICLQSRDLSNIVANF